jgi:hypothetical protein
MSVELTLRRGVSVSVRAKISDVAVSGDPSTTEVTTVGTVDTEADVDRILGTLRARIMRELEGINDAQRTPRE